MVTVYQCTLMAEAAEAAPVEVADAEAVAEAAEALAQTALEGKQKALVEGLFKAWDFNGDGGIDRTKLQTTGVEGAPPQPATQLPARCCCGRRARGNEDPLLENTPRSVL